jgi:hypothetical protein
MPLGLPRHGFQHRDAGALKAARKAAGLLLHTRANPECLKNPKQLFSAVGEMPAPHLVPMLERVHARIRPGVLLKPRPLISFYPYVDTRSTVREQQGRLQFRLSDHLAGAPDLVLEGVFSVLLCRMHGLPERRADAGALAAYRAYVRGAGLETKRSESRRLRGRKHIDPVGTHRSLLESYLRVTLDMGLCMANAPTLSWSRTVSRRRLGHWDEAHNTIVISRVLDDDRVPGFVLDYVLYHELLHVLFPIEYGADRRRVHPPTFKQAERRFPRWQEAERWLEKLAAGSWRVRENAASSRAAWRKPAARSRTRVVPRLPAKRTK